VKAWALLAFLIAGLAATDAGADLYDQAWKQSHEAYFRGDYRKAAAALEEIDRQGIPSADLYYNMGVTYFRMDDLGRAVWSFSRAVTLDPDDEDARFNLAQARKVLDRRATDRIEGAEREPAWIGVVTTLRPSTETWLFLVLYLGTFVLLFLRLRAPVDERGPLTAAAAIAAVAAALAGLLLVGRVMLDRIPFAIVLPEVVEVKEGADANYRTSFRLHAGLRVQVLEDDQGWTRIRLANGLEGWVRQQDVGRL
jgi:tetratricopeptide (TPR) repeat protein